MEMRKTLHNILYLGMIVCCGIALNEGLKLFTDCVFPLVVDLSGTMGPAFYRGDLLLLTNYTDEPIRIGDIVVIKIHRISMPITHRVIKVNEEDIVHTKYLTKGDENVVDDRGLYEPGQKWLGRQDIVGKVKGVVPYLGKMNISMQDNVGLKCAIYALIAAIFILRGEKMFDKPYLIPTLLCSSVSFVERFGVMNLS